MGHCQQGCSGMFGGGMCFRRVGRLSISPQQRAQIFPTQWFLTKTKQQNKLTVDLLSMVLLPIFQLPIVNLRSQTLGCLSKFQCKQWNSPEINNSQVSYCKSCSVISFKAPSSVSLGMWVVPLSSVSMLYMLPAHQSLSSSSSQLSN